MKDDGFEDMVREIAALAAADLRSRLGRSRSGVPRTRIPAELDPARIVEEAVPAIILRAANEESDPLAPGSRLGGYPNAVPPGGWPMVDAPPDHWAAPAPMSFIAQIELAPLRGLHPLARHLPAEGALLFFLDEFQSAEGGNGDPYRRPCRVVHVPALDRSQGVRPPPLKSRSSWSHHEIATGYGGLKPGYREDCYPATRLDPARGPAWRQPGWSDMKGLPFLLSEAAARAAERWRGDPPGGGASVHTMFGVPAANMSRGGPFGEYPGILDYVPGAVPDPRIPEVAPPDDPWVVLLQVASAAVELRLGGRGRQMLWMDAGFLCFFIRRSALEAQDWSAVVAVLDG